MDLVINSLATLANGIYALIHARQKSYFVLLISTFNTMLLRELVDETIPILNALLVILTEREYHHSHVHDSD